MIVACCTAAQIGAAAEESLDAKDTDEAALMVAMEIGAWDGWRRECSALFPADARGIASYYFRWLDANRAVIVGMRTYAEHEKKDADAFNQFQQMQQPEVVASVSQRVGRTPREVCAVTFGRLKDGEFDFARKYPGAAQMLARYLAAHPLSSQGARGYDHPLGCMKAAAQKDTDYEVAAKTCSCAWESTRSALTEAEWIEYEAAAASKTTDQVNALPQFQRMLPKMAVCAEKFAAR
jgi:hypothetical protein